MGWGCKAQAQSVLKDSILPAFTFGFEYTYQFPFADIKKLYGSNSSIGGFLAYKTKKNFLIGAEGTGIIGEDIRDGDPLHGAYALDGTLIGSDGTLQGFQLHERGFMLKMTLGQIIHFKKPNVNSGILIQVGGGIMQTRTKIEVDQNLVPQLAGDYTHGYDHMSRGGVLSQFIGYQYMGVKRFVNFYGGIEITEGFLKGKRAWDYATNQPGNGRRNDVLIGIKFGWFLPKYYQQTEKYYYN